MEQSMNLPSDCWSIIFSYLTKIKDIRDNSRVCRIFNILVNSSIEIVDDENSYEINFNLLNKWPKLHTVYLEKSWLWPMSSSLEKTPRPLISISNLTIQANSIFVFDTWKSYWLDPKRTQEEFDSISHKIYYTEIGLIGWFNCDKGTINGSFDNRITAFSLDMIINLTKRFFVKFCHIGSPSRLGIISRYFKSNIGIKLTDLSGNFNPFHFLYYYSNVIYIEMDPNEFIKYIPGGYQMKSFLESLPTPCPRPIDIKFPIYLDCLDLFHSLFPKVRSITVIAPRTYPLPCIPNVKLTGYDPIHKCYF